jgi:hypothetical protein
VAHCQIVVVYEPIIPTWVVPHGVQELDVDLINAIRLHIDELDHLRPSDGVETDWTATDLHTADQLHADVRWPGNTGPMARSLPTDGRWLRRLGARETGTGGASWTD